jgi:hypothetical protein
VTPAFSFWGMRGCKVFVTWQQKKTNPLQKKRKDKDQISEITVF